MTTERFTEQVRGELGPIAARDSGIPEMLAAKGAAWTFDYLLVVYAEAAPYHHTYAELGFEDPTA